MRVDYVVGGVSFATGLGAYGDRPAVLGPDGEQIGYTALDLRVRQAADQLGQVRRLVLIEAGRDLDSLVAYLAALRGGHPVLLAPPATEPGGRAGHVRPVDVLVDTYRPDVICSAAGGSWRIREQREGTAHRLHPDLALLLSTSGTTGSTKLVRLSAANLVANATAIADYLAIRPDDRAAASLPMHYCYGLSVINSNLSRGAALWLPDRPVTDPRFWAGLRERRCTSLHGVPHTFELLDQVGFPEMRLPDLRYVTQAGGRLPPGAVRRYAELGERDGWRLFVMYGQTEATARMAYLPPELAHTAPDAVGVPIPGGELAVDSPPGQVGELIYRGPNVMLGYARTAGDLALGRTVDQLRTGDLGRRRPDGLYEVVGRSNRVIKPFGLRVDLEHVEHLLHDEGFGGVCTGTDDELVVVVSGRPDPGEVRRLVAGRVDLPAAAVRVVVVREIPRQPNGKVDHSAVARLARPGGRIGGWAESPVGPILSRPSVRGPAAFGPAALVLGAVVRGAVVRGAVVRHRAGQRRPRTVRGAFRAVFPTRELPNDATFVGLGGDSLSYVRMTVELQRVLGHLPPDWDSTPIDRLARLGRPTGGSARGGSTMETAVVLRAVAIVLVVGSHIGCFRLLGGAHLLLGVSGWAFARFALATGADLSPSRAVLRSVVRAAVPSVLWISWRSVVQDDMDVTNALLLNQWLDPHAWGYWYVETLCQALLLLALVFSVPAVRRLERAHPFGFAAVALLVTSLGRLFPDRGNEFSDRLMSTHLVLWLFVLGWLVHRARTPPQRALTLLLVGLLVPDFFVGEPARGGLVAIGLAVLLLAPRTRLPGWAVRPVGAVASASLVIYLTHYAVYPALLPHLPGPVVLVLTVAAGVLVWWGLGRLPRPGFTDGRTGPRVRAGLAVSSTR